MNLSLSQFDNDSANILVGTTSEIQYNSSAITNQFAKAFYSGDYLTEEIKNNVEKRLNSTNPMGLDLNYGVFGSKKIKSIFGRNPYYLGITVGVYNREHADLNIPPDLFRLIFNGNKQFAGETIYIGGLDFTQFRYQEAQLGFSYSNGCGKKLAMAVSFINGEQYASYSVPQLNFYTSETGDEINIDWNAKIQQSNPTHNGFGKNNGFGTALNIMYQFSYNADSADNNHIRFEINDLGFVNWSSKSETITSKDTVNYTGYYIADITDIHDSILQTTTPKSVINQYTYNKTGKFTTYLPARFSVTVRQDQVKNFYMNVGMQYRILANFNPYFYFEEHYQIKQLADLALRLGYGGYSKFAIGLNSTVNLSVAQLQIGTNNLEGLLAPKHTGGFSAYGKLIFSL